MDYQVYDTLYLHPLMSSAEWAQCIYVWCWHRVGLVLVVLESWEAYGAEHGAVQGRAREPKGCRGVMYDKGGRRLLEEVWG